MSDVFDMNLLSNVTAIDRKLNIAKERVNVFQEPRRHEHRKHGGQDQEQPQDGSDEERSARGSPGDHEGAIDITV